MTTTIEYALMAGRAYISNRSQINQFPIPDGWTEFFHVPDLATPTFPVTAGFEAVAFKNKTNPNEIIISFAGTNGLLTLDQFANSGLATGWGSDQLTQAVDYYLAIKAENQNANITFTGHSLGGGLAALMGVFFGVTAVTFDQAPFANSAELSLLHPDVAANLKQHLESLTPANSALASARDDLVSSLNTFLMLRSAYGGIPNSNLINSIRVDGEFLSVFPIGMFDPIGSNTFGILQHATTSVSGTDLHAQSLLTAMLQSGDTPTSTSSDHTLGQVTYKLTDLLGMLFDKNLYQFDTDKDKENFIDRLVRHEAGNAPISSGGTVAADAMVTRFTADLWKLAQDGGLTMNDGIPIPSNAGAQPQQSPDRLRHADVLRRHHQR